MGALYGFLAGAAVGTGVTLLCTIAWRGESSGLGLADAVTPGGSSVASLDKQVRTLRMQRDIADEKLAKRDAEVAQLVKELAAARAAVAAEPDAPAATATGPSSEAARPAPGSPTGPAAPGMPDERAEARRAWREFVNGLQATAAPLRKADATPAERATALQALLAGLADADPRRAAAAAEMLASVADHLAPVELAKVEEAFRAAPTGAPVRAGLAAAVARGLARDARLGDFLASLPPVDEPRIRETVLRMLDRDPSAAYRAWAVKLSATEQNPDVLDELWDEDRIVAALTRDSAAPLREAIEPRLAGPELTDAQLRGRGYLAVALCGTHDPDGAMASLRRLVAAEANPKVKALGEAMLDVVARGEANLATLVRLWRERRRELRE